METKKIIGLCTVLIFIFILSVSFASAKWYCGDDNGVCRCRCIDNLPCSGEYLPLRDCFWQEWSDMEGYEPPQPDTEAPVITINNPIDGALLQSTRVPLDIEVDEEVELSYSIDGGRVRSLCRRCTSYDRTKYFREGRHVLKIIAEDSTGLVSEAEVEFSVDSKKPRISKVYPSRCRTPKGRFVDFEVKYKEDNLESVNFFYKLVEDDVYSQIEVLGCEAGYSSCIQTMDFGAYNETIEIGYYFEVADAINVVKSREYSVKIDPIGPTLTVNEPTDYEVLDRKMTFDIDVSEDVKLSYSLEYEEGNRYSRYNGREYRLCSRCDSYSRTRSIRGEGEVKVTIKAEDSAGNTDVVVREVIFA